MRRAALSVLALALTSQAHAYGHWNDVRHSALLPDDSITVRVENPSGAGVENYLLFAGNGIEEEAMIAVPDGPSTVAATVPGPTTELRRYGLRLVQNGELDLMPVRIADGVSPVPSDLTRLASDPTGDELYGYQNLDIVDCHVSFSGTRLYGAITNAGGGFPVSQLLTFFGYVLAIADPALSEPDTVFVLMHTYNQPGVITPGLYKVTGTDLGDLVRLGDITVQTYAGTNQLMISCALADLMADPYFASWYDPADPALGLAAFTQRITLLGGVDQADESPGGTCSLRECSVAPFTNELPSLSGLAFMGAGPEAFAQIDYDDADGHCPVTAEIVFDGGPPNPMYPQTLDYSSTVTYATEAGLEPLAGGSWMVAVARFSDNLSDVVELSASNTGVSDDGSAPGGGFALTIAPSPFSASTSIEYAMPTPGHLRVEICDVRGRLVRTLLDDTVSPRRGSLVWDGRDDRGENVSSGVYFCRVAAPGRVEAMKLLLAR